MADTKSKIFMRSNDTSLLGFIYFPIVFFACLHHMNPSAFNRAASPVLQAQPVQNSKDVAKAIAEAKVAKYNAMLNAESDCLKRKYIDGGKGAPTKTTHYFDFFIDSSNSAHCSESTSSYDLFIEFSPGDFIYSKNPRYTNGVTVKSYSY
ncbi:hypothetical protein F0170_00990 [Pseudomonas sp. MAFF 730085]|uniref:Uncharacterized protein n=1 Tax=Pseudomonas kitaguniensis TaxID=2607908 RepID=A0A5N7JMR5_9PSED|nr:hypothetical protein [Pseudomonas kitaguniensis]MPQ82684.1 hypothetical protein [Pseudomonas kitaguniensis]